MTMTSNTIKSYILEFKDWLSSNRPELNRALRKYGAIKYYLVTMSIGIIIFAGNGLITGRSGLTWNLTALILVGVTLLFSSRIAFLCSGVKSLEDLPIVKLEISDRWFKHIDQVVGDESILLNDFYVTRSIKRSERNHFELISFLRSMVLISDAVIDERGEDKVTTS